MLALSSFREKHISDFGVMRGIASASTFEDRSDCKSFAGVGSSFFDEGSEIWFGI